MMHPEYFDVRFQCAEEPEEWPSQFAVITAFATTGETWSVEENLNADWRLEELLRTKSEFIRRLTGYSPKTGHAEPGWAAEVSFEDACDIGMRFKQDALYFVKDAELFVSHCDSRRTPLFIDSFLKRLDT